MRIRKLAIAAAALAAFALSASARTLPQAADPASVKLITVSTHGNGPIQQHITLALSKAAVVQLDTDARDVLVSDPDIVDAVVRTPRRIFLLGQRSGQTNAFFFDAAGHQILVARHPRRAGRDRPVGHDERRSARTRPFRSRR